VNKKFRSWSSAKVLRNNMKKASSERLAFTLTELLVVISIIGILVGISLPAVMMIRESARRTSCINNSRQIAISLQNYHAVHKSFPMASGANQPNSDHGPLLVMLEYIEQQNLANSVSLPVQHSFGPPFADSPTLFRCPSDMGKGLNYRANIGSEPYSWKVYGKHLGGNGVFNSRKKVTAKDVVDGLSNTVAFAERKIGNGNGVAGEDLWIAGYVSSNSELLNATKLRELFSIECPKSSLFEYCGHDWLSAGLTHSWYNHIFPPGTNYCDLILDPAVSIYPPDAGAVTPSSNHSRTITCSYADGSVRSISTHVESNIWIASGTIDSTEAIVK